MEKRGALPPEIAFHLVRKIEGHKIVALQGGKLLPHEAKYLEFHQVAGVIIFERNAESFAQLSELLDQVRSILSPHGLDPLIMVDHEGDLVSELKRIIGCPPSALAVGTTGDPDLAREVARETGAMMAKLGVNTVLAPVADCCFDLVSPVTGIRCFSSDPERVAAFVSATVAGFHEAGVLTCVKHFPGHGSTCEDSHRSLPVVDKPREELEREDLVPFVAALEQGVDMVMAAHVSYPTLGEEGVPASFSKRIITGLLREKLGYRGVVVTDALEMEGAKAHGRARYGGLIGGIERPLLAGADLLLLSRPVPERMFTGRGNGGVMSVEVIETIITTLEKVVDRSRIEGKLQEAAREHPGLGNLLDLLQGSEQRIERLRRAATRTEVAPRDRSPDKVIDLSNYPSPPRIYRTVAQRSVVLARDPQRLVPVRPEGHGTFLPLRLRAGTGLKDQEVERLVEVLCRRFPHWYGEDVVSDIDELARRFRSAPRPVVLVFSTRGKPEGEDLSQLAALVASGGCSLVMVTCWPVYEWVPEGVGVLLTLGASPQVASFAADVLGGRADPCRGDLPL